MVAGQILGKLSSKGLEQAIVLLNESILRQAEQIPKAQIFLKTGIGNTLSSNVSNGVFIFSGFAVPAGFRGIIEDFNLNFTTAAGTVRLVIMDKQDNTIQDLLRDISSSINGIGSTVIEEGQKIGIVGQTAGLGVFTLYFSRTIQKVN